jgi:hypothetical protein
MNEKKTFTAAQKHEILIEFSPHSPTRSFAALAARHDVPSGRRTVYNWYQKWDGTIQSLLHQSGAGRPRIMEEEEVMKYIQQPIQEANRSHNKIRYPNILDSIKQNTDLTPSLRTVQNYGEKELGARLVHGVLRTSEER